MTRKERFPPSSGEHCSREPTCTLSGQSGSRPTDTWSERRLVLQLAIGAPIDVLRDRTYSILITCLQSADQATSSRLASQ